MSVVALVAAALTFLIVYEVVKWIGHLAVDVAALIAAAVVAYEVFSLLA